MSVFVGRLLLATALLGTVGSLLCTYLWNSAASGETDLDSATPAQESLNARLARETGKSRWAGDESAAAGLQSHSVTLSARAILSPHLADLEVEGIERLPVILDRLRPPAGTSFSGLLHSWHLFGDDLWVADFSGAQVPFRDLLLKSSVARQHLGDAPVVARTRYGARFPLIDRWQISREQLNTQAHHGQALSLLAEHGVPLNTRLAAPAEPAILVQDVLDDTIASFQLTGEFAWDAVSLAIYLPPESVWINKYGDRFSFDDLAVALIESDPAQSSCAGTHQCISLAVLVRSDEVHHFLSPVVRTRVIAHLSDCYGLLEKNHLPAGGWDLNWRTPADSIRVSSTHNLHHVVLATGHHLEWLALVPDHVHADRRLVQRASIHLLNLLDRLSEQPSWVRQHYCPAVHAANALAILTQDSRS